MSAARDLVEAYVRDHPDDVARRLESESAVDGAALAAGLSAEAASVVLQRLAPAQAAAVVAALEPARAAAMLEAPPLGIAAGVLRRLDRPAADAVLEELPIDRREALRHQLDYPADSAAGVMDALALVVPVAVTAGEARALLDAQSAHLYYYLYVIDADHRLVGVFDMAELIRARADQSIRQLMEPNVTWLRADAPLPSVFAHPGWRELDALPVVDADGRFLGVLRHQRMRQLHVSTAASDDDATGVRTVIALGEIYWLGLSGLLQGFAASAAGSPQDTEEAS